MTDRSVPRADIEHTVSQRRDPFLASTLDGYRIDEKIAEGGFGAVYRATHLASGDVCALKVLRPHFARDPNMTARFQREAATMERLRNRHTVTTRKIGEADDGTLYIAMELLVGEMLKERLQRVKTVSWIEAVRIGIAVCESLGEAHALGVVHREGHRLRHRRGSR
jgi:eukaryotic-like serine/threonine-protein kinase